MKQQNGKGNCHPQVVGTYQQVANIDLLTVRIFRCHILPPTFCPCALHMLSRQIVKFSTDAKVVHSA